MATILSSLFHRILMILLFFLHLPYQRNMIFIAAAAPASGGGGGGGKWNLLLSNIGTSAMHMQLLHTDRVVILDRTDFGPSNISLPNKNCRNDPINRILRIDCTAHSVEYDVASNSIRPLTVLTNVWCSSGSAMPDGSLMQTGGFNDGGRNARVYKPCTDNSCDWQELDTVLSQTRFYSTNHILPDGRQIIIGGRGQFSYEFYPKKSGADMSYNLPFMWQTNDLVIENNLYPFVFLNVDGNLFIFANNRAILFDYVNGVVVKTYPMIPGGDPRSNPSSGSAVLLPLRNGTNSIIDSAEVLVCGGAPKGSYPRANIGIFMTALNSCGRIEITNPNPQWVMETMPLPRVMGDMVLLPNGNVLIINGASAGTAGWEVGRNPVLTPVIYRPNNPIGSRFEVQKATSTPRMYHSTAILLRDGRVLVGGSNPHAIDNVGVLFPTDLTIETYSPDYLDPILARVRPKIVSPVSQSQIGYRQQFAIDFTAEERINTDFVKVAMVAPPYNTHSFSMNQRLLVLTDESGSSANVTSLGISNYQVRVLTPSSNVIAPSGYYLLFVVYREVPSVGIWVQIK